MLAWLESRVASRPDDASAWRMLGRAYLQAGDADQASGALARAVQLDPRSPAAHFDLASALWELERVDDAAEHDRRVKELAPQSEYGGIAEQRLAAAGLPDQDQDVVQVGFEIKRFDGSQVLRDLEIGPFDDVRKDPPRSLPPPVLARIEFGALYNTNVALTPSSRDFALSEADSAQAFFNPQVEYWLVERNDWRAGPLLGGYFSLNESDFRSLNLQSYQPGLFVERSVFLSETVLIPRVQYVYTLDQFDGGTFAQRHAVGTSLSSLWDSGDATVLYWSIDQTDFASDGVDPDNTSRDGWSNALGLSHTRAFDQPWLASLTAGADVQLVDAEGADFTYNGVSVFAAAEVPLTDALSLIVEGGWGYRDYHESDLTPSRNENVWRGGARLLYHINEFWTLAGVFNYDRFDAENPLFDADRVIVGATTIFEY